MQKVRASELVGPKPLAAVRPVSLAVKRYVDEHKPDSILIAVSGGADSMALAVATIDVASRRKIPVSTVTVDHGIRADSAAEAQRVRNHMVELGAKDAVVATAKLAGAGLGPEGDARELRYRLLYEQVEKFRTQTGAETVDLLLGHTMDDQAETMLLRLGRGAGSRSLAGMRPRYFSERAGGTLLGRPLLEVRRQNTEEFCRAIGLFYVNDPTNRVDSNWRTASGEPLRRAAVRQWALPQLKRALGQDPVLNLARSSLQLQDDNDALDFYAHAAYLAAVEIVRPGEVSVEVAAVSAVPPAVRRRVWRLIAHDLGAIRGELTDSQLRRVDSFVGSWRGQGEAQLPGGVRVTRRGAQLHFRDG